jgi:hypothetical protein
VSVGGSGSRRAGLGTALAVLAYVVGAFVAPVFRVRFEFDLVEVVRVVGVARPDEADASAERPPAAVSGSSSEVLVGVAPRDRTGDVRERVGEVRGRALDRRRGSPASIQ